MKFSNDTNQTTRLPSFSRISQLHKSVCGWNLGEVTCVDRGREMNCLFETPKQLAARVGLTVGANHLDVFLCNEMTLAESTTPNASAMCPEIRLAAIFLGSSARWA
jgi:hypothetical protein